MIRLLVTTGFPATVREVLGEHAEARLRSAERGVDPNTHRQHGFFVVDVPNQIVRNQVVRSLRRMATVIESKQINRESF